MTAGRGREAYRGLPEEARICARCGACRTACPVYAEIGWESSSPRGRIELARRALRGEGGLDPASVRRALECTLCGGCRDACPAEIDTRRFLLDLRGEIRAAGRCPGPYLALAEAVDGRGNISPFDNASRADWLDEVEDRDAAVDPASPVGYFVGCVASFYPMVTDIPASFAGLAARMGRPVSVLGPRERCCGFPLIAAGMEARAAQVIRHNLEAVRESGIETLVTGCPSCLHTWTHAYPEAAGGPLGFEVLHLAQYLLRCLDEGVLDPAGAEPLDLVVTYHDPCDLGRNLGEYDAPREVLRRLPGVRLVEMAHTRELALCCGGGGNLQAVDPDLTRALAARRVREALDTGASVLVTACQQCVQVLAEAARRSRARLRVLDIVQLVGEAFED